MAKFINVTLNEVTPMAINIDYIESFRNRSSVGPVTIFMNSGDVIYIKESFEELLRIIDVNTEGEVH